jgi:hypothetical protein
MRARSSATARSLIQQCERNRLTALLGLHHLHRKSLSLLQSPQPGTFDDGDVNEHILAAILANDEAEPFLGIEPLDRAFDLGGGRWIGALSAGWSPRRWSRDSRSPIRTGVHREDRRDLTALLSLADLHTEFGFRLDCFVPGRLQHGNVQKCVPRAVGEYNEPEAFVRIEPLDDGVDRRTAWGRTPASASSEGRTFVAYRGL